MPDVFISYTRADRAIARHFAEGFEREGLGVWWDQALNPGEAFDQITERALEEAKAVVVLWSKASVDSRWVRAEATQANATGRMVPVMIEPCRRPIIFELTHTVDLSNWRGDPIDHEWQALVLSVRRVVHRTSSAGELAGLIEPPPPSTAVRQAFDEIPPRRGSAGVASAQHGVPRRKVLLYGAAALGLAGTGFVGGALLHGARNDPPPLPPSFHRLTFRRGLIRSARFAPDGKTILYGALWDGDRCRVHSTRTDNPESRPLDLPEASVLAVSRTGDLALSIGRHADGVFTYGTLARVPIAGGAPREMIERVKFADWAPDGTSLAVVRNLDGVDQLEYPLGTLLFRPQASDGLGLGFARISPDGQRVAFIHYRHLQSLIGQVCLVGRDGKVQTLTDSFVNIHGLAWRGSQILFTASDDRPLFRSLRAVAPGSAMRTITRLPVNVTLWDASADGRLLIAQTDDRAAMIGRLAGDSHDRDLSWLDASWVADISPDGRKVLFTENGHGVGSIPAAYLRGTDGSPAVRLGSGQSLALSPDKRFALIMDVDGPWAGFGRSIDVVPTGAGEIRRLPAEDFMYAGARWLPGGKGLLVKAHAKERLSRVFRVDLPDGRPVPMTAEGVGRWALSPDGTTIAAAAADSSIQLYPLTGGAVRTVPDTTAGDSLIGWVEDGLLFMPSSDSVISLGEVYLHDPATGRRRSWTNILPRDSAGIMLMGNFVATPDGSTCVFTWHRALSNLYIADGVA